MANRKNFVRGAGYHFGMLRHLVPFLVAAVALMACAPATLETTPPAAGDPNVLADSRLSRGDHQLDSGEYYEALSYAGQAGQFLTISLASNDFDPYLMVLDPNGEKVLEIDDSVGYGLNIVVSMNLPMTGSYTLVVTTYEPGETGRFNLSVASEPSDGSATPVWQPVGGAA